MKIERDKWYLTRGGDKVRVVCVDAPGDYPVIALTDGDFCTYTADGFSYIGDRTDLDLVAEYREPARVWVNFYPDGEYEAYDSEHIAREEVGFHATRVAIEFVEVVK